MPVALQNAPGYYAEEVLLQGSTFRIRELPDAILREVLQSSLSLQDAQEIARETPSVDVAMSLVTTGRGMLDRVCQTGVVSWDLDAPCTPENIILLPPSVKAALTARIMQVTTLAEDEAGFSTRSPKG